MVQLSLKEFLGGTCGFQFTGWCVWCDAQSLNTQDVAETTGCLCLLTFISCLTALIYRRLKFQ